ncbi:MAG: hypothetical protein KC656_01685, partial [Myxococcales bacterium]|nr:hypothetical protein [Myxococcales bacterium]
MPWPIAAAWSRVLVASSPAERQQRAVEALGVVLRFLAGVTAAGALQSGIHVDPRLWAQLARPSLGHWLELLRELTKANPAPFVPELREALLTGRKKPSATLTALGDLVSLRNRIAHGGAADRPEAGEIEARLREVLASLPWLESYRLLRVVRATPRRDGDTEGDVQLFAGQVALTEPVQARWTANLVPDALYLVAPEGDRVLEVSPFLEVRDDPVVRAPRCMVVESIGTTVRLESVETGGHVEVRPSGPDGPVDFSDWLAEPSCVVHATPVLAGHLAGIADEPEPTASLPRPVDAPRPSRLRVWGRRLGILGAVGAVLTLACAGVVGIWMFPTYDDDVPILTPERVPVLYVDPADQRRLEAAHAALMEGDELEGATLLLPLLEAPQVPPEVAALGIVASAPAGRVFHAFTHITGSRIHEDSAAMHCARELGALVQRDPGPLSMAVLMPRLLRLGFGMSRQLDAHPDDLVAIACMTATPQDFRSRLAAAGDPARHPGLLPVDSTPEAIEGLLQRRPGSASLRGAHARALAAAGRLDDAARE